MMRFLRSLLIACALPVVCASAAIAGSPVTVQDINNLNYTLAVNSDGSVNVVCTSGCAGGGGGGNVNLTGINGVTPLVGAGATGTGSPRTTQAQDTTTVAGAAPTTTGIYVTGPSAAALATSANQTTANTSLATIATNSGSSIPGGTNDIGTMQPWAQPANWVTGTLTSFMTGTTDTSLIAAPGANLNNYLVSIVCGNTHATVSTGVNIKDGSGGTVIGWVPAAAVYGGSVVNFGVPLKQPTANTALYVADDTTGASVKCTATGFKR